MIPGRLQRSGLALADRGFRYVTLGCGLVVLSVLVLIAVSTTNEARPVFQQEGLGFLTERRWAPSADSFGALAFIFGTLGTATIAVGFAVPLSVGIALFVTEVAPRRMRKATVYVIDLLAAIPSVVFGFWGLDFLGPKLEGFYKSVGRALDPIPVLNQIFDTAVGGSGRTFLTAGLILALMITPIITSITREVFDTVPKGQKEAAFGLGATRWEMIRGTVFPHSRAGVTGAVMLGLGRAMGETIAAALVIGSTASITLNVFAPGDSMPAVIANQFGEAGGTHRSALIGLGVVLFGITIIVNIAARTIAGIGGQASEVRRARRAAQPSRSYRSERGGRVAALATPGASPGARPVPEPRDRS